MKELNNFFSELEKNVVNPLVEATTTITKPINTTLETLNESTSLSIDMSNNLIKINELWVEGKRIDLEFEKAYNEFVQIITNHQKELHIINKIFDERKYIFEKLFKVIDTGLLIGNNDMVIKTMQMINAVLNKNPLMMIEEYRNSNVKELNFDNDEPFELDF